MMAVKILNTTITYFGVVSDLLKIIAENALILIRILRNLRFPSNMFVLKEKIIYKIIIMQK